MRLENSTIVVAQTQHFMGEANNQTILLYYSDLPYYKDLIKTCQMIKMIATKILKK